MVDIDDVVVDYCKHFRRLCKNVLGWTYEPREQVKYRLSEFRPGVTLEQEFAVVDATYHDKDCWLEQPEKGAPEVLQQLKQSYRLVAVTARTPVMKNKTMEWLTTYLPGVFDEVLFISIGGRPGKVLEKINVAKKYGAAYFIEDNPDYLVGCAEAGIQGILFDKPWNQKMKNGSDFTKVYSWAEILPIIMKDRN